MSPIKIDLMIRPLRRNYTIHIVTPNAHLVRFLKELLTQSNLFNYNSYKCTQIYIYKICNYKICHMFEGTNNLKLKTQLGIIIIYIMI